MSRYTAGAHRDALAGLHVLVIAPRQVEARDEFDATVRQLDGEQHVILAQGREHITDPGGGSITYTSARSASGVARGRSFDILVYTGVDETPELHATLRPCQALSLHPDVIHT